VYTVRPVAMKGLFGRSSGSKSSGKNSIQQAVTVLQAQQTLANAPGAAALSSASEEPAQLRAEVARLQAENDALKGQIHLYQFKMELLLDMCTLANLDCDKLEDELEAAGGGATIDK
jgi:hypothetical protein